MNFEDQVISSIKQKVLSEISKTEFTTIKYSERKAIPDELLNKMWDSINWDEVVADVRLNLQTRICNSIVASMETELKTDVKKLLSVDGVRQKLRIEVYPKLMKVLNETESQ